MKKISIDIETFSVVDLKSSGVYRYAEDDSFEILLFAYSVDEGEVLLVDLARGEEIPWDIIIALSDEVVEKWAFNAQFERVCLSNHLGQWLAPRGWHCSMVWSATLGLPLSLDSVGAVLGLEKQKFSTGKSLISYFCKPCSPTKINGGRIRNFPRHDEGKWQQFKDYNVRDVDTEQEVQKKLVNFPVPLEIWEEYWLDQQINDLGIAIDQEFVKQAIATHEQCKTQLTARMVEITGLENPNSVQQLSGWLKENGLEMPSLDKKSVEQALNTAEPHLAEVLRLRQQLAKSSVKKYTAMENCVCKDSRAHGMFQFYGANRTGRWCLTGDHEVLSDQGWVSLDQWQGGYIACWNPHGELISFQKANQVSFEYQGEMYHYEDKRISQISTPDHKMYVKRRYDSDWGIDTIENMKKYRPSIPFTGFRQVRSGLEHSAFRVLIMVQADGHFTQDGTVRLKFSKERKVARCKQLLRCADITYSLKVYQERSKTIYQFNIANRHIPIWLRLFQNKTFGTWLFDESPDVFFEELVHWDGHKSAKNSVQYVTCNKDNADMVQAFAHLSGRSALVRVKDRRESHPNWSVAYVVDIWLTPKNCHQIQKKPTQFEFDGLVYCAETPTGFFLVRRGGKVWVTGNSGRHIQLQNLAQNHMPDLAEARSLVRTGDFDCVSMLYDNIPVTLSELIRTAFVPEQGRTFLVADFSAIEARVIAWLAGEKWRMKVFAEGGDIYCASASQMFKVPVEKHGQNSHLRQKGKQAELACIAEGSLVLTDKGLIPIEDVALHHKVWDGGEWVSHEGVVYRGEKEVLHYDGLTATPDHLVWVEGSNSPVEFAQAITNQAPLQKSDSRAVPVIPEGKRKVYDIKNAGKHHRFTVSNILVHNCGYGGSKGALISMGALDYGMKEEELQPLVTAWREANPKITKLWWDVDKAAKDCVKMRTNTETHGIKFSYKSGFMFITLPSGRKLAYVRPRIGENKFGGECVTYEGVGENKKWLRLDSYGPKFVENIVQAIARDLLMYAIGKLSYCRIVAHVHDELIIESEDGITLEMVCEKMGEPPPWAKGLLLGADGYECLFYKKD